MSDGQDALLDAAVASFLEFGIRRTSMGEIAKRAGISPATLYRRFGNKDDIVLAAGLRELNRALAEIEATIDREATGPEQIAQWLSQVLESLPTNPLLRRLLETDADTLLPMLTVQSDFVLDFGRGYIGNVITGLQASGKLPDVPAEHLAELVARLTVSFVMMPASAIPYDESPVFKPAVVQAVEALIRGLA